MQNDNDLVNIDNSTENIEIGGAQSNSEVLEMSQAPVSDAVVDEPFLDDPVLLSELEQIPDKLAFKIGEVAELLDIKPYVLRYWETEFDELRPKKSNHNQRMYSRHDVKMAFMIKKLLYRDRFSIEGARKAMRRLRTHVKQENEKKIIVDKFERNFERLHILLEDVQRLKKIFQ